MNILRADALGMCFGVRDALKEADRVEQPESVAIHGELVHNESVLAELNSRGFHLLEEDNRLSTHSVPTVMITAHGISRVERSRLLAEGKRLIDTTCPLVAKVHTAAEALAREGFHVLIVGRPGHVEVRGIVEDLPSYDVVEHVEDVRCYGFKKLGILCQSTAAPDDVDRIRVAIHRSNPNAEIRFVDTVCQPTKDRQKAVRRLVEQVDCVVVVGGRNSNNTRRLVALCEARGVPAYHVQNKNDLEPGWFREVKTVGLTAGTSTPDATIDEVQRELETMSFETL